MNNSFINVILIQMANNLIVYRILIREKYLNLFVLTSSYSVSSPPIDDAVMIYIVCIFISKGALYCHLVCV